MQITIDLPDNLSLTETAIRTELAIALYQQQALLIEQAAQLINIDVDDFHQILVDRAILTPPTAPDDTSEALVLAHLRISLQEAQQGKTHPIAKLWDELAIAYP